MVAYFSKKIASKCFDRISYCLTMEVLSHIWARLGRRVIVERLRHSPPLPPVSSTPVGAARSRPGRQVGDPYQAQKLLACSNQRDTTYSPFTLTYYLRPRRWAMPGGSGHRRIGTGSVASLSVVTDDKKSLANWRDFSVCVGITYLPGKSPCKYCRRR